MVSVCICGYGDVGTGSVFAIRGAGVRVMIAECDPIWTSALETVVNEIVIFVTNHWQLSDHQVRAHAEDEKQNKIIVGNIGHLDNEVQMAELEEFPGI